MEHLRNSPASTSEVRRNTQEVIAFISTEIKNNFKSADLKALLGKATFDEMVEANRKAKENTRLGTRIDSVERGVIDLGTEIRERGQEFNR